MTTPAQQPLVPDEDVERDDAVIGVALRKSAYALLGLLLIGGGAYAVNRWMQPPPVIVRELQPIEPIKPREDAKLILPSIPYRDITTEAGISFVHENGAAGEKLLPETMGGGCAFLDYDSDGDQDILLVNSQRWAWDTRPAAEKPATHALYQNDGTGKFADVTEGAGLNVSFYGMGVAAGDYDNDGDADLCFTSVGQNRLFRNESAKFVEVTHAAGIGGAQDAWGSSCGWLD